MCARCCSIYNTHTRIQLEESAIGVSLAVLLETIWRGHSKKDYIVHIVGWLYMPIVD